MKPLLDEAGADEQQRWLVAADAERLAHGCAGETFAVRAVAFDAWRQGVEPVRRRAVDAAVDAVLRWRDGEDARRRGGVEDRLLEGGEVAVAQSQAVDPGALRPRLVLEAGIAGVVHVEARHLVHADQQVGRFRLGERRDLGREAALPHMAAQTALRQHHHACAIERRPLPRHRVDAHLVATLKALDGDLPEITRHAAVGKELEDCEGDPHRRR